MVVFILVWFVIKFGIPVLNLALGSEMWNYISIAKGMMLYYDYETYQMLQIRLSEYYFAMANFTLGSSHKEKLTSCAIL